MKVDFNTPVSTEVLNSINLMTVAQKLAENPEVAPLLAGKGLNITDAPMDLEKLVAQLRHENDEAVAAANRDKLSSVYAQVIARALENASLSEANMAVLEKAQPYQSQLKETNKLINGYEDENGNHVSGLNEKATAAAQAATAAQGAATAAQTAVAAAQGEYNDAQTAATAAQATVTQLEATLLDLENELAAATSEAEKSVIQGKITDTMGKLQLATAAAKTALDNQGAAADKLQKANDTLQAATKALATANAALTDATAALSAANAQKAEQTQKIAEILDELVDDQSLRDLINDLRDAASELNLNTDIAEDERTKEEEEYLEKNSPVRIIQDALLHQDLDFLDAIESKRDNRI